MRRRTQKYGPTSVGGLLVFALVAAAPARADPVAPPPPLPPAPGYPPRGLFLPGDQPPLSAAKPPLVGSPPAGTDARGLSIAATSDGSQPVLGMPGSQLGTAATRIGIGGLLTPGAGVEVGVGVTSTLSPDGLEDSRGNPPAAGLPDSETEPQTTTSGP